MAEAIDQHRGVLVDLAREVLRVAAALGVRPLGFDGFEPSAITSTAPRVVESSLDQLIRVRRADQKTHSGVWRDLAVRKRRTEVDALFQPIIAEADKHGLEVPLLRRMVEMIHDIEVGRRSFCPGNLDELAGAATPSARPA
jgi:2-dehydropantoate 2-reductase